MSKLSSAANFLRARVMPPLRRRCASVSSTRRPSGMNGMSRQRQYQLRHKSAGLCYDCSRPAAHGGDSPRVTDPATERGAIQTADDWNADSALGLPDILKIGVRIDAKFGCSGFDLLFKQRMKYDRGCAPLFHRANVVDLLRNRRGRRNQRRTQRQPEILRSQI